MVEIELTLGEMASAAAVGIQRQLVEAEKRRKSGKADPKFSHKSGSDIDVAGALAEHAVAKYFNVYFKCGINTFANADVDPDIQVKWVGKDKGELFVPVGAKDKDRYVLVKGDLPFLTLVGWISVPEAKKHPVEFGTKHKIPQSSLRQMETLNLWEDR